MRDQWTDFERHVLRKLDELTEQVATLRSQAAVWGAIAGVISVMIGEIIVKVFVH